MLDSTTDHCEHPVDHAADPPDHQHEEDQARDTPTSIQHPAAKSRIDLPTGPVEAETNNPPATTWRLATRFGAADLTARRPANPAPGRAQHALQTARVDRPPPRRLGAQAGPAAQRAPQTDGVIPWPLDHRAPTAQLGRPLALEVVPSTHSRQRLRPEQQLALTCEMMPRVPAQSRRSQTRAAAAAQAAAVRAKMA
jgi:hypothetical protein